MLLLSAIICLLLSFFDEINGGNVSATCKVDCDFNNCIISDFVGVKNGNATIIFDRNNCTHGPSSISFIGSSMPSIPRNLFVNISTVNTLSISSSGIESLQPNVFGGANNLQSLLISNNSISNLEPGLFLNESNLSTIDFSYNQIEELRSGIFPFVNKITEIVFSHNNISEIDDNLLLNLTDLRSINLGFNKIEKINLNFSQCTKLKTISLNDNRISLIDVKIFEMLHHLDELDLSRNQLKTIDTNPLKQNRLNFIVRENQIKSIALGNWNSFDATNNGLINLNISENTAYDTRELKLSGNSINNTENIFKVLIDLEYLDLSNTKIGKLDSSALKDLISLKELHLCNCSLSNVGVSTFYAQKSLKILDISHNDIDFKAIDFSSEVIEEIYIDGNNLTNIEILSIGRFTNLKRIEPSTIRLNDSNSLKKLYEIANNNNNTKYSHQHHANATKIESKNAEAFNGYHYLFAIILFVVFSFKYFWKQKICRRSANSNLDDVTYSRSNNDATIRLL